MDETLVTGDWSLGNGMGVEVAERARVVHERVLAARGDHRRAEHALAVLLAEMEDARHLQALGYASLAEYARGVLDLAPAVAGELARVGRKLPRLPCLAAAFERGDIAWSKVREVARVATADTESAWLVRAGEVSCRQLEQQVADSHVGAAPPDCTGMEPARSPARRRVVFEMESTDAELLLEALRIARARAGLTREEATDGAILADMARRVIHQAEPESAPTGAGEPYRIVLEHCPDCGRTAALDSEVSDTVVSQALEDAEVLDMRPGPTQGHVTRSIAPTVRRKVLHRDRWRCTVPGCEHHTWLHLHHDVPRAGGGSNDVANLRTLCGSHHRAIHEGALALEPVPEGAVFVFGDGRRVLARRRRLGGGSREAAATKPGRQLVVSPTNVLPPPV